MAEPTPEPLQLPEPGTRGPAPWCYWVIEGRFLAGPYPGAPDEATSRRKLSTLLGAGIRTFLNLMEENERDYRGRPFAPYEELARSLASDVHCLRIPVRDLSVPSRETMIAILDVIDGALAEGRPLYLHCWGGVGRTGTAVGCWLLRHKLARHDDVLETLARLREADLERGRRASPETEEQRRFVREWRES